MKKTSKNIHVAIVIDAWFPTAKNELGIWGGGQVHVQELTKALMSRYPVTFTLFFPAHPNVIYRGLWPYLATIRLILYHRKHPFHLIHSHGIYSGLSGYLAAKITHLPTIHTVHGSHLMDLKSKSLKAWVQKTVLTKLTYSAQISVASSFLKHSNNNKNITVISNGVNVAEYDEIKVEKNPDPTIIWVGRDSPVKGLNILRQAVLKVRKQIPNLKTKLITGGVVTGKALIRVYKKSHVFVLPSLAEGQPITLLEAWAARLPVVVTDVGDNALMVKDGINGYVVEPGNVHQLANAILKTLRARTKDIEMGQNGYRLVKEHYTWDVIADKTWAVYQGVLK